MTQPHARRLRDRRLDRSRRIAQSLFVTAAASSGVGIGLIAHASAAPQSTTTTTPTTTTPTTPSTTVPSGHPTTTRPGATTTTTVWRPPTTVPVTVTTTCHTSASGQFLGCW